MVEKGSEMRLLSDETHLCSEKFLKGCLDLFVKPSELIAASNINKGIRPQKLEEKDKMMAMIEKQEQEKKLSAQNNKKGGNKKIKK